MSHCLVEMMYLFFHLAFHLNQPKKNMDFYSMSQKTFASIIKKFKEKKIRFRK